MKLTRKKLAGLLLAVVLAVAAGWLLLAQYGLQMPDLEDLSAQLHALLPNTQAQWAQAAPTPTPSPDPAVEAAADPGPGQLQVYYLDVVQGDATLILAPDGDAVWAMLIDTGEYAYADGLTDALKGLGVARIDALVCTHPHLDHMGCMARIVQRFEIGALYMPLLPDDQVPATSGYEALLRAMSQKSLPATRLMEGTSIPCPAAMTLEALAPDPNALWDEVNDYSGVLRLTWGSTVFLFMGDAEKPVEQVLLYSGHELSADVLKVGHHGSSSSTSAGFLEAVRPGIAVISCGRDNQYGHPHREVRSLLEDRGVETYRTDLQQTILITSDGTTLAATPGLPSVARALFP